MSIHKLRKLLNEMENDQLVNNDGVNDLRVWCHELTDVDTHNVIGEPGWPSTFAECLIKAMGDYIEQLEHDLALAVATRGGM